MVHEIPGGIYCGACGEVFRPLTAPVDDAVEHHLDVCPAIDSEVNSAKVWTWQDFT